MHRATILVVEDNETQRRVISQLCESFDFDVHMVSSGEEALDACACTTYAAILLDLGLPGINGYECAKRLRELERKFKIRTPIIAVTSDRDARTACIKVGMDDYISKPFDHEAFRILLLRWAYQADKPNLKLLKSTKS